VRPLYRARQFWQAITAAPGREPPCALAPGLAKLYRAMPRSDRAHALRTYRRLEGPVPPALAVAALLHDVGKARGGVRLWQRVVFVLAGGRLPGWLARQAGLAALAAHAARGAELLAAAGAEAPTVELVRHHHDDPASLGWPAEQRALLEALQRADEAS
jgi:hypothetical protein